MRIKMTPEIRVDPRASAAEKVEAFRARGNVVPWPAEASAASGL